MKSARLRLLAPRVLAGAGLLALALAVWFLSPPRGGNIQTGDVSVRPRFVKVTRGTPCTRTRRDPAGCSVEITNYSHTIDLETQLGRHQSTPYFDVDDAVPADPGRDL